MTDLTNDELILIEALLAALSNERTRRIVKRRYDEAGEYEMTGTADVLSSKIEVALNARV